MIERLLIQNLVLIDRAEIAFGPGLNILTGETGSGKSALLAAIRLILGERADLNLLRHGAEVGVVEATLANCTIRRELHRSGKSRAFIDDALVSLQELREHLSTSIQIVDQGSAFELAQPEMQRKFLDDFAENGALLEELSKWKATASEELRALDLLSGQQPLDFAEEINWQKGEEEALATEHHMLTHAQEIQERVGAVLSALTENHQPFLRRIVKEKLPQEPQALLNSAACEIDEAVNLLSRYLSQVEVNPDRLLWVETRIGQIEALKRRYRVANYDALQSLLAESRDRNARLIDAKARIDEATKKIGELSKNLMERRKEAAPRLVNAVLQELRSLNLSDAELRIEVTDSIVFYFSANRGHPPLPLSQVASGGELSRLLFTLILCTSAPPCLIFDEIDSNVGGTTASLLGQKLQTLAAKRQLICVTHFVQVAKQALHHFRVSKSTQGDDTYTHIEPLLTAATRAQEYTRMMGLNEKRETR